MPDFQRQIFFSVFHLIIKLIQILASRIIVSALKIVVGWNIENFRNSRFIHVVSPPLKSELPVPNLVQLHIETAVTFHLAAISRES